jgi:short-subunit dehydrogenase
MIPSVNEMQAVVTGASSGIGEATARKLAAQGMRVALVARRHDRLEALAREICSTGGYADAFPADLTLEADRTNLIRQIDKRFGDVDVLVNNAGIGWYGYGSEMRWSTARAMLGVNVEAVVQVSLGFLTKMRARHSGHIINIGSISGKLPSQGIALYGATKSFLDNFTTGLYRELIRTGVHVSVIRAGAVRTEFGEAALKHENGLHVPTEKTGISAEKVAERVWKLIRHPRRVSYLPGWLWLVPWIEMTFGWIIDLAGPLLLKRQRAENREQ